MGIGTLGEKALHAMLKQYYEPEDYLQFVPEELQAPFTSKDYKKATGISLHVSQRALNILHHMGVVERVGKQGNLLIYERS